MMKPRQAGGLLHQKISPPPDTPEAISESIYDPKQMETRVLEQNHTHLVQIDVHDTNKHPIQHTSHRS